MFKISFRTSNWEYAERVEIVITHIPTVENIMTFIKSEYPNACGPFHATYYDMELYAGKDGLFHWDE